MTAEAHESRSTNPFQEFFRTEAAGGALLVACACAALVVANSGWADAYHRLLTTRIAIAAGGHELSLTVHQWVNDALMAVFFLLVGLEIKREALAGELASTRQAALPISDERQVTNLSLPTQIRVCEEYCRQHGWEIVARFQEEGESAHTTQWRLRFDSKAPV